MACASPTVEHQELSCPVCFELYSANRNNPNMLIGCGHTICDQCVQKLLDVNQNNRRWQNTLKCPFCNKETRVPPDGLPTNFGLRDVVSKFSCNGADGSQTCSSCHNRVKKSTFWYCGQCARDNPDGSSLVCCNCAMNNHRNHHALINFQAIVTQKKEIWNKVKVELDQAEQSMAEVEKSKMDLIQIQENLTQIVHQKFSQIKHQLNPDSDGLLDPGQLVQLREKVHQFCTQLTDSCRETVEAQNQAQRVMERCLQDFLESFQDWEPKPRIEAVVAENVSQAQTNRAKSILVIGGRGKSSHLSSTMEWVNPWNPSENRLLSTRLSPPRSHHVSAVLNDGRVLVAGGWDGGGALSSVLLLDPIQEMITEGPSMNTGRNGAAAATLDGVVYVCGGQNVEGCSLSSCERFQSGVWDNIAPMSTGRCGLAMVSADGKLYAIGGWGTSPLSLVEVYDPNTNCWTQSKPMPTAREGLAAAVLGTSIIVCGGCSNVCEKYDVEADCWTVIAPMKQERLRFNLLTVGDLLVAIGGAGQEDSAEVYDPREDQWTLLSFPQGHSSASAVFC